MALSDADWERLARLVRGVVREEADTIARAVLVYEVDAVEHSEPDDAPGQGRDRVVTVLRRAALAAEAGADLGVQIAGDVAAPAGPAAEAIVDEVARRLAVGHVVEAEPEVAP